MGIYNGLKNIPNFNLIHWTYEVRGLWYLSTEANYKYKKIYSLKKSYLDHLQSIEKQALESCNQYICITDEVAEYIKRTFGIYNKPHCMIYNAICMKTSCTGVDGAIGTPSVIFFAIFVRLFVKCPGHFSVKFVINFCPFFGHFSVENC